MALSRWSHSDHYIYVCDDDELQICGFGHFTTNEIFYSYDLIESRAKEDGYSFLSRLELRYYLKSFAKLRKGQITFKQHVNHLVWLRRYGIVKRYCSDPWDVDFQQMIRFYFNYWK